MKRIVYGSKMKKVDSYAIEQIGIPSMVLMERAAFSVYEYMVANVEKNSRVICVCGTGNNGADGIALARMLCIDGYKADVLIIGKESRATDEWHSQRNIARKCDVNIISLDVCGKDTQNIVTVDNNMSYSIDKSALNDMLMDYDIIVDGIFGIGIAREVEGIYRDVIEVINNLDKIVYSLDVPSGLCADTGNVMGVAVKADITFTFGACKAGLWLDEGREYAGKIVENPIGFPEKAYEQGLEKCDICYKITQEDISCVYERKQYSNKGTYGKVLVIGGSKNVYGAAYFATMAAMKLGSGLVRLITHVNNRNLVYEKLPEAMINTYRTAEDEGILCSMVKEGVQWADAVVIGPGLSKGEEAYILLKAAMSATKEQNKPIVIDADGLNLLSEHNELAEFYHKKTIITPHIGEAARLVDKQPEYVAKNIIKVMGDYGRQYGITIVAKDATTVIIGIESSEDKCHNRVCINTTGNPGMATGGSGDVLAGMIGASVSGGIDIEKMDEYIHCNDKEEMKMYLASSVAVYLHGLAGDSGARLKGETSLTASDILDNIGAR